MRRLLGIFLSVLFLVSCSGTTTTTGVVCKQQYWDGTVGLCLPAGWSVVPQEKLAERGLPPEVITGFQRDTAISGQTPVLLVTKEVLAQQMDSPTYSQASIRSVTSLPGYKLLDTKAETVDGQSVQVHVYSAQPNSDEPERRFYQVSVTDKAKTTGYTFTALAPLSVDTTLDKEILLMLSNVTLQQGEASSSK